MKKFLPILSLLGLLFSAPLQSTAQDLFDINTIRTIEITFAETNWDYILDTMAQANNGTGTGTNRLAGTVVIDGNQFDSVGVRFKGNSSYDPSNQKNPLNLELDWIIPGQDYLGYSKIKLANGFTDPSMIREALAYELAGQYMHCPRASFVKVYINGDYKGIYTNTESINKKFLAEKFYSNDNPFFKCDPRNFDFFGGNSNLYYATSDTTVLDTLYDMKSDYGLTELMDFTYELTNNPGTIDQHLNVDRALWFHAFSNGIVHMDGYYAFAHNFYFYKDDFDRWNTILWDVNMSFGGLLWDGTSFFPNNTAQLQQLDPFHLDNDLVYRPLLFQLLNQSTYRKQYMAHLRTIVEENLANNHYLARAGAMQGLIDSDVQNEPYGFFTYAEFIANRTTDIGSFWTLSPGLQNLIDGRVSYLNTVPEFTATPPAITSIDHTPQVPAPYSTVTITAQITGSNYAYLGYRSNPAAPFTRVQVYDDGLHGDGAAGDGIFGETIPTEGGIVEYYFYAENAGAGMFSPVRAEHEFWSFAVEPSLVLNEWQASNGTTASDELGEFDDWVELYNNTNAAISLNNYHLSDEPGNPTKWTFPDTTIAANDYLIVWADNSEAQGPMHTNFKLSAGGEALVLSDDAGSVLDQATFPAQLTDLSYGRYPNGVGPFQEMIPTHAAENSNALMIVDPVIDPLEISVFPNPTQGRFTIMTSSPISGPVTVYNSTGQVVLQESMQEDTWLPLSLETAPAGLYLIQVADFAVKRVLVAH